MGGDLVSSRFETSRCSSDFSDFNSSLFIFVLLVVVGLRWLLLVLLRVLLLVSLID